MAESDPDYGRLDRGGFADAPNDQGMSLEHLTESFARLLGQGDDPYQRADQGKPAEVDGPPPELLEPETAKDDAAPPDETCPITPRSILEAMLFVGNAQNEPLTSQQVAALMRGVRPAEIGELVRELNASYAEEGCPYTIESYGPGYRMVLRSGYYSLRAQFYGRIREARLSDAAIDVLAVVAYNQPIGRQEIERLREKPSGAVLAQLVRRQLLRVDRPDDKARTALYHTTDRFLSLFGLESLEELPRGQELAPNQ